MPPRPNKGCSANLPPLCMPPQRPVLESLRLSGPVLLQLPPPGAPRPRTSCSALSPTYSYEEEYCNAETCCSSNSCIQSKPVEFCPFGKREDTQSCRGPCRPCQGHEEEECKGPCRKEATPQTCKGVDASTDAAVRFFVDNHTSAQQIMPPRSQSMPCFSDIRIVKSQIVQESPAQMSSEVPLCCRPGTDTLTCPPTISSPVTPTQSVSASVGASGMPKPCCAISDATFQSGQQAQSNAIPNRVSSIASGTFQKMAATPTCPNPKDKKKRKCEGKGVSTESCSHAKCPANSTKCTCRFPPAYSHFLCTGNIAGTCNCVQNK